MSCNNEYALDNCIKCSICVSNCPVTRVTDKYAGPKQNGPDLERFRLETAEAVHPSVEYCTNCKNCDVACPSGVNISAMISRARGNYTTQNGARLRDRVLAHAQLVGKVCSIAPGLVNWGSNNKLLRWAGEKLVGISKETPLPRYAKATFFDLYRRHKPKPRERKVVYYPGCYVQYNAPDVGLDLVQVMARNGVEVLVDEFNCCGLPLIANGFLAKARLYAEKNMQQLQGYINQGYDVITSCPSCNLTLRSEYRELFQLDTKGTISRRIFDVCEYLLLLMEQGELNRSFNPVAMRTGYHQPCHLQAQACGVPSAQLLRLIPGLRVENLDAGCCGQSGSYGFKAEKYQISREIGQNVALAVKKLGVTSVLSECGMCQARISHAAGVKTDHPIHLLAKAYGLLPEQSD